MLWQYYCSTVRGAHSETIRHIRVRFIRLKILDRRGSQAVRWRGAREGIHGVDNAGHSNTVRRRARILRRPVCEDQAALKYSRTNNSIPDAQYDRALNGHARMETIPA